MSPPVMQQNYLIQLLDQIDAINERVKALGSDLDDAQLNSQPADGGWSIGQVFEHLVVANDSYVERIRDIVRRHDARRSRSNQAAWRPTLMGRLIADALRSTRNLPAPRMYRPSPRPRPNVVDEFLRRQHELAALVHEAEGLDWRRVRTRSPVTPLVRLNLGDC